MFSTEVADRELHDLHALLKQLLLGVPMELNRFGGKSTSELIALKPALKLVPLEKSRVGNSVTLDIVRKASVKVVPLDVSYRGILVADEHCSNAALKLVTFAVSIKGRLSRLAQD